MRPVFFSAFAGLLLLTSCAEKSALAPAEVMERAAVASAQLVSLRFEGNVQLQMPIPGGQIDANAHIAGVTQEGGKTMQVATEGEGTLRFDGEHAFTFDLETIRDEGGDSYVHIKTLTMTPPHPLFPLEVLEPLLGQWWHMQSTGTAKSPLSVSPDPALITAQSRVVTVTSDRGIQKLQGKRAYRYDVAVDREKLVQYVRQNALEHDQEWNEEKTRAKLAPYDAKGELWIDAENYSVLRVVWTLLAADGPEKGKTLGTLDMQFSNHNAAPPIVLPTDAKLLAPGVLPFSMSGSTNGFPLGTGVPPALPGVDDESSLLKMLQQQSGAAESASVSSSRP